MKFPSRARSLQWLLWVAFVLFAVPFIGKRLFPLFFGMIWIQWICWIFTIINVVIIPLGFFLSISSLFSAASGSKERKKSGWAGSAFLFFFWSIIFFQLITAFAIDQIHDRLDSPVEELLPKMISKVPTLQPAEKRENYVSIIYRVSGVSIPYQLDDGSYSQFKPSFQDEQEWSSTQKSKKSITESLVKIHGMAHQIFKNVLFEIALFFLIVSVCIFIECYKPRPRIGGDTNT